jgi:hypothetical protein
MSFMHDTLLYVLLLLVWISIAIKVRAIRKLMLFLDDGCLVCHIGSSLELIYVILMIEC